MTPDDIDVWVGLDVGKSAHHAHALDHDGNTPPYKRLRVPSFEENSGLSVQNTLSTVPTHCSPPVSALYTGPIRHCCG